MIRKVHLRNRLLATVTVPLWLATVVTVSAGEVVSIPASEIGNGTAVLPRSGAVSTGQPDANALRILAENGYVAVIDLRGGDEDRGLDEQMTVEGLGMTYVSLPIADAAAVSYTNAAALDTLLAEFDGPVLVHCGSGNRVGALVALRERLRGSSADEALKAGKAAGLTRLEPLVRKQLASSPQ